MIMSGRVEVEKVNDWQHFVGIVHKFDMGPPHEPIFLFRGQAREDWTLVPSLVRMARLKSLLPAHVTVLEDIILQEFKKQAHLHLPPGTIPGKDDLFSWWNLMQHHHAPTRLLDWTYSPFVALYFACEQRLEEDGAVWMVASKHVSEKMTSAFPDCAGAATRVRQSQYYQSLTGPEFVEFLERNVQTAQMAAQQTMHSVSTSPLADHEQLILKVLSEETSRKAFRRLIIPARKKIEFLRSLRFMNVTSRALFPGVHGLGRSVAELALLSCNHLAEEITAEKIYGGGKL